MCDSVSNILVFWECGINVLLSSLRKLWLDSSVQTAWRTTFHNIEISVSRNTVRNIGAFIQMLSMYPKSTSEDFSLLVKVPLLCFEAPVLGWILQGWSSRLLQ